MGTAIRIITSEKEAVIPLVEGKIAVSASLTITDRQASYPKCSDNSCLKRCNSIASKATSCSKSTLKCLPLNTSYSFLPRV